MKTLISILVATGALAFGQASVSENWTFELKGGIWVAFSAEVTSDGPSLSNAESFVGRAECEGNVIHRTFTDSAGRIYFGYDMVVEKLEGERMRVSVRRLSTDTAALFFTNPPAPAVVSDGDRVELDVMEHYRGQAKAVDRFLLSSRGKPEAMPHASSPPRDLTIADIWLQVSKYVIKRNGITIETSRASSLGGSVLIASLPADGAVVLSLAPTPGYDFKKVAVADNDRIVFSIGNNRYEWISSKPIIQHGGTWNVWMYHDPSVVADGVQVMSASGPDALRYLKR